MTPPSTTPFADRSPFVIDTREVESSTPRGQGNRASFHDGMRVTDPEDAGINSVPTRAPSGHRPHLAIVEAPHADVQIKLLAHLGGASEASAGTALSALQAGIGGPRS